MFNCLLNFSKEEKNDNNVPLKDNESSVFLSQEEKRREYQNSMKKHLMMQNNMSQMHYNQSYQIQLINLFNFFLLNIYL